MNITKLEKQWLIAYMQNDIVSDYGWEDKDACGWTVSISDDSNIVSVSVSGVISSLVKKGLIIVQNHTEDQYNYVDIYQKMTYLNLINSECNLTDKGRDVCSSF